MVTIHFTQIVRKWKYCQNDKSSYGNIYIWLYFRIVSCHYASPTTNNNKYSNCTCILYWQLMSRSLCAIHYNQPTPFSYGFIYSKFQYAERWTTKKIKWKILNEQRAIMSSRTNTCLLRVAWICIVCVSTNTPTRNSATPSPMFGHIAVASLFLSGILLIIRIPHRITLFALHMCFRMAINTNARSYDTQHQQYDGRIFWKRHTPCLFTTTAAATFP